MLTVEEVQEAILTLMKQGLTGLVSTGPGSVGPEIREDNWMSRRFNYPALRLQIQQMGPQPNNTGECNPLIFDIRFSILVYAEGASSLACAQLMSKTAAWMVNKQIHRTGITPVTRIVMPAAGLILPVPESESTWRGEVQLFTTLKDTNG